MAENAIEVDRVEQVTDTKVAEEWQAKIQSLSDDLTHEKSALDLSRRRQSDLTSQLEALESEKQELGISIETERERVTARAQESEQIQRSLSTCHAPCLRRWIEKVRAVRLEADKLRRELENTKRESDERHYELHALTSKAASLLGRMESAQAKIQRLEQQVEEQNSRLKVSGKKSPKAAVQAEETRVQIEILRNRASRAKRFRSGSRTEPQGSKSPAMNPIAA